MDHQSCPPRADHPEDSRACPVTGAFGPPVSPTTVTALLTDGAVQRLTGETLRFCPDPVCEVVYFGPSATFTRSDVRVPVWQKEPTGARVLCYCFGENEASIVAELQQRGASCAVERVRAQIAAGCCACEVRNPRGICCLGDLIAAVDRARHPHQPPHP